MAGQTGVYFQQDVYNNATISESTIIPLLQGLGSCNQITVRLVVGDVTGGSDAIDFDVNTYLSASAATEIVSMTQATGATSETVIDVRDASTSWGDRNEVEVTVAAGSTATGVYLTIIGSNA